MIYSYTPSRSNFGDHFTFTPSEGTIGVGESQAIKVSIKYFVFRYLNVVATILILKMRKLSIDVFLKFRNWKDFSTLSLYLLYCYYKCKYCYSIFFLSNYAYENDNKFLKISLILDSIFISALGAIFRGIQLGH